jgi:hypothetical protein
MALAWWEESMEEEELNDYDMKVYDRFRRNENNQPKSRNT